jgi:hypothetical protein
MNEDIRQHLARGVGRPSPGKDILKIRHDLLIVHCDDAGPMREPLWMRVLDMRHET